MDNLNLKTLIEMPMADIQKLKKDEIIKAVKTHTFYFESNIEDKKRAEQALVTQRNNEDAAIALMVGYLGLPTKREGKYGEETIKYSLLDLVGRVLSKAARYDTV